MNLFCKAITIHNLINSKKEYNFKRFKIENGNIVLGNNWDMIFPVYDLYNGKLKKGLTIALNSFLSYFPDLYHIYEI